MIVSTVQFAGLDMLTTIFVVFGISASLTAALDLMLSDARKQKIADANLRLWNWLDEAERLLFLDWLKRKRNQISYVAIINSVVLIIGGCLVWIILLDPESERGEAEFWAWTLVAVATAALLFSPLGYIAIARTMRAETTRSLFLRAIGFMLAASVPPLLTLLWLDIMPAGGYPGLDFFVAAFLFVVTCIVTFISMLIIVLPIVFVYSMLAALSVSEFLGSGLIQIQKAMMAARTTVDKKLRASLS